MPSPWVHHDFSGDLERLQVSSSAIVRVKQAPHELGGARGERALLAHLDAWWPGLAGWRCVVVRIAVAVAHGGLRA